jgi:hypothetical protein
MLVINLWFIGYSHSFPALESARPFFSAWLPPIISGFLDAPRGCFAFSEPRGLYSRDDWDHFLVFVSAIHHIAFEIAHPEMPYSRVSILLLNCSLNFNYSYFIWILIHKSPF